MGGTFNAPSAHGKVEKQYYIKLLVSYMYKIFLKVVSAHILHVKYHSLFNVHKNKL